MLLCTKFYIYVLQSICNWASGHGGGDGPPGLGASHAPCQLITQLLYG